MKRFCTFTHKEAGIPYLVMSWSQPLRTKTEMETMAAYLDAIFKSFPRAGTKAFVVELEQASTPNILKGLRESALYLRKAEYLFPD